MLYVMILLLNVLDLITTHFAVNVFQVAVEANPFMAPIVGTWLIVPVKLIGAFLMAYGLHYCNKKYPQRKAAKRIAWFVLILYILVVLNNGLTLIAELYVL